jgi:tetratricopeptide (TPR) repeat protein
LVRLGETYFALGLFNDALESMTKALDISPTEDASRAKILNNIGVIHYQLAEYDKSLQAFISALEIQRQWLDSPIRRQPIVYDASVTMCNMGKLYIKQGQYKLSYNVFEEAFVVSTSMDIIYSVVCH